MVRQDRAVMKRRALPAVSAVMRAARGSGVTIPQAVPAKAGGLLE